MKLTMAAGIKSTGLGKKLMEKPKTRPSLNKLFPPSLIELFKYKRYGKNKIAATKLYREFLVCIIQDGDVAIKNDEIRAIFLLNNFLTTR